MTGTEGGAAGGRDERDWAPDRSHRQSRARHPHPHPPTPTPRSTRLLSPTCSASKVCTKRRPTAGCRVLVCWASARPSPARRPAGTLSPQTGLSLSRGHGICSPPPTPRRPSGTGEAGERRGLLCWLRCSSPRLLPTPPRRPWWGHRGHSLAFGREGWGLCVVRALRRESHGF